LFNLNFNFMKTKFGAVIVAGSGKIGGHVASKNRSGSYLRTKVTPVNPQTAAQTSVRNRLASISASWAGLTAAQRDQWNGAVSGFKGTDIFGDVKNPSGFNLYQALNNNLAQIGQAAITVPPVPTEIPVIETGVLAAVHAGAVTLTFTSDPDVSGSSIVVDATSSMSAGKSFVKSELRRIGEMPAIVAHVSTITTLYNAKFGAAGTAGQKIFVRLKQIDNATGQAGIPVVLSCVIS
jgi:hypothetical protein